MFTHTLLAAALLFPPAVQPPPGAPPVQQAVAPQRRDQELVERLRLELAQPLTEMGWGREDQDWFAKTILPSRVRRRLKIDLSPEDAARFDNLKPRTNGNVPVRDDALVLHWVLQARNYATLPWSTPKEFYRPFSGMATGLKPGLLRLWIDTRCGQVLNVEPSANQIAADLAEALADPDLSGERARNVAYVLSGLRIEATSLDANARAAQLYAARPDADKWFADYFVGITEIDVAWRERGSRYAAQTTDDQFRRFSEHLAKAEASLVRAHKARPQWAEAAQAMITVTMGQGDRAEHTPLYWYEQAVKADPADDRSASALAFAAAEKWAGAAGAKWIDRVIADAQASTDYTSTVPCMVLTTLINSFAEEEFAHDLTAALKSPGTYERAQKAFSGYLSANDPAISPNTARSWLLFLAKATDRPAEALRILNTPGFTPRRLGTPIDAPPAVVRYWATLATSTQGDALTAAEKTLRSGDLDGALKAFEQIVPQLNQSDDAAFAAARTLLIKRLQQAVPGKPADLSAFEQIGPFSQTPLTMLVTRGGWSGRTEPVSAQMGTSASLVFAGGGANGFTTLALPAPLGLFKRGYELTFDADLRGTRFGSPLLNIRLNHAAPNTEGESRGPWVQINVLGAQFDARHSGQPRKARSAKPPVSAKHQIRILVRGWKAEVWCNGELADWSTGPQATDRGALPGEWLTFDNEGLGDGQARIEHLTIAPLDKDLETHTTR